MAARAGAESAFRIRRIHRIAMPGIISNAPIVA